MTIAILSYHHAHGLILSYDSHALLWLCMKWGSIVSDAFLVANGVRQDGVLSPVLFTMYMDELLLQLKCNDIGCHWDHFFTRVFCYADDFILLAPSLSACESFSISHGLKFIMLPKPSSSDLGVYPPVIVRQLFISVALNYNSLTLLFT